MLPIILGIAAKAVTTGLTVGKVAAFGAGIGAAQLLSNNRRSRVNYSDDDYNDDDLDELIEALERKRRNRRR